MGYITLTGDSDGDLHTAALHNEKFGAIASVLNGNVDHDNLKYPKAMFTWEFGTHKATTDTIGGAKYNTYGPAYLLNTTTATGGAINATTTVPSITASHYNLIVDSYRKALVPLVHQGTSAIAITFDGFASSQSIQVLFQTSTSLTGTWTTIATGSFDPDADVFSSQTYAPLEITMNYTTTTIAQNSFFRALYRCPTGGDLSGDLMPIINISIAWKTNTVT